MAKIDRRSLPIDVRPAIVNGNTKLIGAFVSYETTTEERAVLDMARAHRSRSQQKSP
jgi:hypothetical protein